MTPLSIRGWDSEFPEFSAASQELVLSSLRTAIGNASPEQVRAWTDSIGPLQHETVELMAASACARKYATILEYTLPLDSRRPDCLFLIDGAVVVLELKGRSESTQADLDQVAAYARDLRAYHRDCADQPVVPVLVPMRARGYLRHQQGIHICGPDALDDLVCRIERQRRDPTPRLKFLDDAAYRPLPTLVAAARELLASGSLRRIHRAAAATEPTVERLKQICHEAATTQTRRLVLLTGIPGSGKTLVGLQTVHAHWLDELSVDREGQRPTAPAVFLSGNGPLVEVLQYELKSAGGGGQTFVRGVKEYLKRYASNPSLVPPEHVLVFDEAQRAYDRAMVADKHDTPLEQSKSEPEHFIEFASRIPQWCVVVGLIGGGQEIHKGEEAGLRQWLDAINASPQRSQWAIHASESVIDGLGKPGCAAPADPRLHLDTELRFHLARDVHRWVAGVVDGDPAAELALVAKQLEEGGYHLRLTRNLEVAREYLRSRYEDAPDRRFGLLASSRDKLLNRFRVYNDFQATKQVRFGPWYGDDETDADGRSCRHLQDCVTEFGAQGLELDAALLAWGSDYLRRDGMWDSSQARRYQAKGAPVHDPHQLRLNSYRVLLTRGRDGTVVFVPPVPEMDETAEYLAACGMRWLA